MCEGEAPATEQTLVVVLTSKPVFGSQPTWPMCLLRDMRESVYVLIQYNTDRKDVYLFNYLSQFMCNRFLTSTMHKETICSRWSRCWFTAREQQKDLLEIAGSADVSLGQFLPLAFDLLLFLVKATVHHVVHVGIVVEAHIVDFRVLDVHGRHWQRGPWAQHIK